MAKKDSFFNKHTADVLLFVTAIILLLVTSVVSIYNVQIKSLVTTLSLQQLREVEAVTKQEHVSMIHDIECTIKIQWYTICMLIISILGIVAFVILVI